MGINRVASFDINILAIIVVIASTLLMFLIIGLSVLRAIKRGVVKSAFFAGINLLSFITAILVTVPLSWLVSFLLQSLANTLMTRSLSADSKILEAFMSRPELTEIVTSIPGLLTCAATMVFVFFLSKIIATIVLSSIIKKKERAGSTFFRKTFPGEPFVAALCGLVSGIIIFTVICVPFNGPTTIAGKGVNVLARVSEENGAIAKADEFFTILNRNPAKVITDYTGAKLATNAITTIRVGGKTLSVQKETELMLDAIDDSVVLIRNSEEQTNEQRAEGIRKIGKKLGNSEFLTKMTSSAVSLFSDLITENGGFMYDEEDGEAGKYTTMLLEELSKTDSKSVKEDIQTMTDIMAYTVEKGYFNLSDIYLPNFRGMITDVIGEYENNGEKNGENEPGIGDLGNEGEKSASERNAEEMSKFIGSVIDEVTKSVKAMDADDSFAKIGGMLNENERIKKITPILMNAMLETMNPDMSDEDRAKMEDLAKMSEMTKEEAEDTGRKVGRLLASVADMADAAKELLGEEAPEFGSDEKDVDPELAGKIIELLDVGKVGEAFDELKEDKYMGVYFKTLFSNVMRKYTGTLVDEDFLIEDGSTADKIEAIKVLSDVANDISDTEKSKEEKEQTVKKLIETVDEDNVQSYKTFFTREYVMSMFGIPDPYAEKVARMLNVLFEELSKVKDDDGRESKAVTGLLSIALAAKNNAEDLFSENGVLGDPSAFIASQMNSTVLKNTLLRVSTDENGQIIYDPMGFAILLSENDRADLKKAADDYVAKYSPDESDYMALRCLAALLGVKM